jgi:hypothetical protein
MNQEPNGQAKKSVLNAERLKELRKARRESQTKFWKRFGVTQSRGSRFELGLEIPSPVAILVNLYLDGTLSDGDLWRARRSGVRKQSAPAHA